jgi:hypothetical protein
MKVKKVQQVLSKDNFIWKGGKVNGYSEEGWICGCTLYMC